MRGHGKNQFSGTGVYVMKTKVAFSLHTPAVSTKAPEVLTEGPLTEILDLKVNEHSPPVDLTPLGFQRL